MDDSNNPDDKAVPPTKSISPKRPVDPGVVRHTFSHGRSKAAKDKARAPAATPLANGPSQKPIWPRPVTGVVLRTMTDDDFAVLSACPFGSTEYSAASSALRAKWQAQEATGDRKETDMTDLLAPFRTRLEDATVRHGRVGDGGSDRHMNPNRARREVREAYDAKSKLDAAKLDLALAKLIIATGLEPVAGPIADHNRLQIKLPDGSLHCAARSELTLIEQIAILHPSAKP